MTSAAAPLATRRPLAPGVVAVALRMRALTGGIAVVALGLCLVSMLSIGFFYLPAAVLLLVATVRSLAMPVPTP